MGCQPMAVKQLQVYFEIRDKKDRTSVKFVSKAEQNIESIEYPCYLFIDQSTYSGYTVFDSKSQLVMSGEVDKSTASLEQYKFVFNDILKGLVKEYQIKTIFYEEVYDKENKWTTEVLLYIKHMIKDMGYLEKDLDVFGVDHMAWKNKLARPGKFNGEKGKHKQEVKKWVEAVYPLLFMGANENKLSEHIIDSMGMGIGLLVKKVRSGGFFDSVRYNKNLPTHEKIIVKEEGQEWSEIIAKNNKPYRDAFAIGGVTELELDRRRAVGDLFKKFLSHRDGVAVVRIPKAYKDWGVILLEHGVRPSQLHEDGEFWLVSVRKKRKK